jgi:tight adherence protein B
MVSALAATIAVAALVWATTRRALGLDYLPWAPSGGRRRGQARPSFQVWLSQAGAAVTPGQFVAVSASLGAAAFVLLLAISHTVVISLLPACFAAAAPYAYWSAARRKQAVLRSAAWPDAVRYLVGVLGAGIATLHDALEELGRRGPVPLRPPMARYARLSRRLGDRAALEVLREELADPIADPVLLAFGGAMEEGTETVLRVLSDLGDQISADLALGEKVRTLQTQSRVANWGCFALPYGVLFTLCSSNASYRDFFSQPLGLVIVVVGGAASLAGLAVARRFVRPIATSRRVFAGGPR